MDKSLCGCAQSKSFLKLSQYYQEVGAELLGNKILIRIERDKNKLNKLKKLKEKSKDWDPTCVCTDQKTKIEPPNESRTQGLKIITVGDNEIIFRLNSRCRLSCDDQNYSSQIISPSNQNLKVTRAEKQDNKIQVFTQLNHADNYDIYQNNATVGGKNLFFMKINNKSINVNNIKGFRKNIELEVNYPKLIVPSAPTPPPPSPPANTPPVALPPPPLKVELPEVEVVKPEKKMKKSKVKKKKK